MIMKLIISKFIGAARPHEQAEKGAYIENSTAGGVQDHLDERIIMRRVILKTLKGQNNLAGILTSERYNKRAQ